MAFSTRTDTWSEDAVLPDGRLIKVEREVGWTFQFVSGDEGSMSVFSSWPDRYWLKFKHPDTQEIIKWQGEQYFNPVLLDIVNGMPYLVVNGRPGKNTASIYGCPELPYIYLRYESGLLGKWSPIPVEAAPDVLRNANLSPAYPDFGKLDSQSEAFATTRRGGRPRRDMSLNDVQSMIARVEASSQSHFQRVIPRSYEQWRYAYKKSYRDHRKKDDCRPPRALPPANLRADTDVVPEVLSVTDYTPELVVSEDEYSRLVYDKSRENNCQNVFKLADPNDPLLGERFVNDGTGKKRVPYPAYTPFASKAGARRLCDEHILFVAQDEKPGRIIVTKYTATGDLVYRIGFRRPEYVKGGYGFIVFPSIKSVAGYLYFDWHDLSHIPGEWHIKRISKMRVREEGLESIGNSK